MGQTHDCSIIGDFLDARKNWARHIARFGTSPDKQQHLLKRICMWRCCDWQINQFSFNELGWDPIRHKKAGQPHRWEDSWARDWISKFSKPVPNRQSLE